MPDDIAEGQPVDHDHEPDRPVPPGDPTDLPLGEQAGWAPPDTPPPGVEPAPEGFSPPPEVTQMSGEPLTTEVAFLVYLQEDGHWQADTELGRPITMARRATLHDFRHAAADITADIIAAGAAQQTLILQQETARRIQEQMQTAQLAAQLGGPVGAGLAGGKLLGGR